MGTAPGKVVLLRRARDPALPHPIGSAVALDVTGPADEGKLALMPDDDRDERMDDETTQRPVESEPETPKSPIARLLANPRRVRRA